MTYFVTCLLSHPEDEEDSTPDEFRKKLLEVFTTIQDHDASIVFLKSYEDTPGAPDITEISQFPRDWSQMLKYVHLKNPNSLRPPWTDGDGNKRPQSATIATLIMSSKRDLGKLLNTLSSCFIHLNLRLSIKEMDSLDESNIYAIMGASNLFDNVALHSVLQRELIKKVEKAHEAGAYVNHPQGWENCYAPEFLVTLIRCKIPPVTEEITAPLIAAMEEFVSFRYYKAIVCPDHEAKWGVEAFSLLKDNSALKEALSRCVSLVEMPLEGASLTSRDLLNRLIGYNWGFNQKYAVTEIPGLLSITVRVRVRMEDSRTPPPYKQTNLARELKDLSTGSNCVSLGNFLIEGYLLVHDGRSTEEGRLQISHVNSPGIREQVNNLADSPAAYFYQILTAVKGFSERCAMDLITNSFSLNARTGANRSSINPETLLVTSQRRSQAAALVQNMGIRGIRLEIPKEIKEEMDRKVREAEAEKTRMHEQLAGEYGVKYRDNLDFSVLDSQASAVTGATHSTDGRNTFRTYDTAGINDLYYVKSDELQRLMINLREMDPYNSIFGEIGFRPGDEEGSLTSMSTIEKSLKFAAMRTQINKLHQTIRNVETSSATASKSISELGMPSTTAILLTGGHNGRTAGSGLNQEGGMRTFPSSNLPSHASPSSNCHPSVGRSDLIEENNLQRVVAESMQADGVIEDDEGSPLSIRGGGDCDSETETDADQTNIRHYSGSDNPYNSEYNQADEFASDEDERAWDENFRRECSEAERLEEARERLRQLYPHTDWSRQEDGVGNWQGAEEKDDHTAGEREEEENSDEEDSQGSAMSDDTWDGIVVVLRPGLGQMLTRPPPNETRSTHTSTTNTNSPRAYDTSSGWGRPRPRFFDFLPDQNTEVNDRHVEDGVPAEPPPLGSHRRIFLGGNLGEPTTAPSPMEDAEVDGRNVEVGVPAIPPPHQVQPVVGNHSSSRNFLGGNLGEPTAVPSPMEVNSTCSPVEAKASTASNEAPNGSPPPNSGSAAPSSPVARSSQAEDGSGVVQES